MARAKKAEAEKQYKEFNFDGEEIKYSGRAYPDLAKETKKCTITPCNVTLNGVITVKGCKLLQTDSSAWIEWPQYKNKDGEYVSYFFIEKEFNDKEIAGLVKAIEEAIA